MSAVTYRDLTTLEEFALVVDLERQIWGPVYDDVVPVSILAVSVHSGGILVGAFESDRMVGFVYSLPGIKDGKPTQGRIWPALSTRTGAPGLATN
jgi:predicted GNAT superfamily acetyltransferase